jgi:hypothetical protein
VTEKKDGSSRVKLITEIVVLVTAIVGLVAVYLTFRSKSDDDASPSPGNSPSMTPSVGPATTPSSSGGSTTSPVSIWPTQPRSTDEQIVIRESRWGRRLGGWAWVIAWRCCQGLQCCSVGPVLAVGQVALAGGGPQV